MRYRQTYITAAMVSNTHNWQAHIPLELHHSTQLAVQDYRHAVAVYCTTHEQTPTYLYDCTKALSFALQAVDVQVLFICSNSYLYDCTKALNLLCMVIDMQSLFTCSSS